MVGAGLAGLGAAKQLIDFGYDVSVLEARRRVGGRILTDRSFKNATVDLGAMLITGVIGHPCTLLTHQLNHPRHVVKSSCPLFLGNNGSKVDEDTDTKMEKVFNSILETSSVKKDEYCSLLTKRLKSDVRNLKKDKAGPLKLADTNWTRIDWKPPPESKTLKECLEALGSLATGAQSDETGITMEHKAPDYSSWNAEQFESQSDHLGQVKANVSSIVERVGKDEKASAAAKLEQEIGNLMEAHKLKFSSTSTSSALEHPAGSIAHLDFHKDAEDQSLQEVLEAALTKMSKEKGWASLSKDEDAVLQWHLANLEYGCATNLKNVSVRQWDQVINHST